MAMSLATPRDFAGLRVLVVARADSLPKRLRQVAAFALQNPDDMAFGTAASISESAGVQPSTLVRFSQAIGYSGFSEMQDVFRERLRERIPNYEERLQHVRQHVPATTAATTMLDGFSVAAEESLRRLRTKIDQKALEQIVSVLAKAETIYLIGLRRSAPIASYMAYAFGKLAVRNVQIDGAGGLAQEELSFATRKDAVLAISFAPYASETVALATAAHGRKVPVVAITDSPLSPLIGLSRHWIELEEANYEGFRSMSATLVLAMTLTVAVADARNSRQ
jgi:DNA-binding MurR/RpiR family transcriptional regulator